MPGVTGDNSGAPANGPKLDLAAFEAAVVFNRPHATFALPSGREVHIYSKSEGQLRLISRAVFEWVQAEAKNENRYRAATRRWRWRARKKVDESLNAVELAKFAMFARIFEDSYITECHQALTVAEFWSMTPELIEAILRAHRAANDTEGAMLALFGPPKKKEPAAS
jgi:hypothetical protein